MNNKTDTQNTDEAKIKFKSLELVEPYIPNPSEAQLLKAIDNKFVIVEKILDETFERIDETSNKIDETSNKIDTVTRPFEIRISNLNEKSDKNVIDISELTKNVKEIHTSHNSLGYQTKSFADNTSKIIKEIKDEQTLSKTEITEEIKKYNEKLINCTTEISEMDGELEIVKEKVTDMTHELFKANKHMKDVTEQTKKEIQSIDQNIINLIPHIRKDVDEIQKTMNGLKTEIKNDIESNSGDINEIATHIDSLSDKNMDFGKDVVKKMTSLSERVDYLEETLIQLINDAGEKQAKQPPLIPPPQTPSLVQSLKQEIFLLMKRVKHLEMRMEEEEEGSSGGSGGFFFV